MKYLLIFLLYSTGGHAVSSFSKVMFSKVNGVILNNGTPVIGARISREFHWAWSGEDFKEETITDNLGKFSFNLISRFAIGASVFPHEPVISQMINISHAGIDYPAWHYSKHNYEENGELKGKEIQIVCDLATKPTSDYIKEGVYGICKLEKI